MRISPNKTAIFCLQTLSIGSSNMKRQLTIFAAGSGCLCPRCSMNFTIDSRVLEISHVKSLICEILNVLQLRPSKKLKLPFSVHILWAGLTASQSRQYISRNFENTLDRIAGRWYGRESPLRLFVILLVDHRAWKRREMTGWVMYIKQVYWIYNEEKSVERWKSVGT